MHDRDSLLQVLLLYRPRKILAGDCCILDGDRCTMGAAASSGQLPEVVDLDAAKSAYALEGYDLDVPRWQKIAEPKGGTLPRAEALRYGPLTCSCASAGGAAPRAGATRSRRARGRP